MKLRHRISLLAGAVLLLVLLTCAGVLLIYSRRTILTLAEDQARDKQKALSESFSSMARYYAAPEDSDAARESLIRYCFTQFADQEGVLMRGSNTLCSSVAVDPSLYAMPDREDSRTTVYRGLVDGRQLLIVASLEWIQTDTLYVGLVRDITEVYDAMARLTRLFLLVCAAGVALGMGLLFLSVKKSTAPLSRLTAATGLIHKEEIDKYKQKQTTENRQHRNPPRCRLRRFRNINQFSFANLRTNNFADILLKYNYIRDFHLNQVTALLCRLSVCRF